MTTLTTAEALRHAADLLEQIGWNGGITWSSRIELGLHMHPGNDWTPATGDPTDALVDRGATLLTHARQTGDDYELDRTEWRMPTGLRVVLYGVSRPIEQVA